MLLLSGQRVWAEVIAPAGVQDIALAPDGQSLVVAGKDNSFLLGAIIDWVNQKVGDRPVVFSCSYSGPGDHDGNQGEERQLDARFPPTLQGRAICFAAGNQGISLKHARSTAKQSKGKLTWQSKANDDNLTIFWNLDSVSDLQLEGLTPQPADRLAGSPCSKACLLSRLWQFRVLIGELS